MEHRTGPLAQPPLRFILYLFGVVETDRPAAVSSELERLHGVGPKALRILQEALENQGLSLG